MHHESKNKKISISKSDLTFEKVYEKDYIPKEYLEEIKKANFLIIPNESIYEQSDILFPETTRDFFEFIRESDADIVPDIAVSDENFKSLELHSALVEIATVIINSPIYDIAIGLISCFLHDYIKKHHQKVDNTYTKVTIINHDFNKNESKEITYEGPVSGIEEALKEASRRIFDAEHNNDN